MSTAETPNVVFIGTTPIYKSQGETYQKALQLLEIQKEYEKEIAKTPHTPHSAESRAIQTVEKRMTEQSTTQTHLESTPTEQTYQYRYDVSGYQTPSGPTSRVIIKTFQAPSESEAQKMATEYGTQLEKEHTTITKTESPVSFALADVKTPTDAIAYMRASAIAGSQQAQPVVNQQAGLTLTVPMGPEIVGAKHHKLTPSETTSIISMAIEQRKQREEHDVLTGLKTGILSIGHEAKKHLPAPTEPSDAVSFAKKTGIATAREFTTSIVGTIELGEMAMRPSHASELVVYKDKAYLVKMPPSLALTEKRKKYLEMEKSAIPTWEERLTPEGVLGFGGGIAAFVGTFKVIGLAKNYMSFYSPHKAETVGTITGIVKQGKKTILTVEGIKSQGGVSREFVSYTTITPAKTEGLVRSATISAVEKSTITTTKPIFGIEPIAYQSYYVSKEPIIGVIKTRSIPEITKTHTFVQEGTRQYVSQMGMPSVKPGIFIKTSEVVSLKIPYSEVAKLNLGKVQVSGTTQSVSLFWSPSGSVKGVSQSLYSETQHIALGQSLHKTSGIVPSWTLEKTLIRDMPGMGGELHQLISPSTVKSIQSFPLVSQVAVQTELALYGVSGALKTGTTETAKAFGTIGIVGTVLKTDATQTATATAKTTSLKTYQQTKTATVQPTISVVQTVKPTQQIQEIQKTLSVKPIQEIQQDLKRRQISLVVSDVKTTDIKPLIVQTPISLSTSKTNVQPMTVSASHTLPQIKTMKLAFDSGPSTPSKPPVVAYTPIPSIPPSFAPPVVPIAFPDLGGGFGAKGQSRKPTSKQKWKDLLSIQQASVKKSPKILEISPISKKKKK